MRTLALRAATSHSPVSSSTNHSQTAMAGFRRLVPTTWGYEGYSFDLQSRALRLLGLALPNGQRIRGDVQLAGWGAGSVSSPAGT